MSDKRLSYVAGAVVVAVLVVAVVVLTTGTKRMTPLTPEMREGLGASAYVPEDVAVYASSYRLADKWVGIWQSNAVQNLVKAPMVQQMLLQAQMHPMVRGLQMQLAMNPLLVELMPILKDAVSTEIFFCAGPEAAPTLEAMLGIMQGFQMVGVQTGLGGRAEPDLSGILDIVVARKENLRVPSLLLGCKLTEPAAATSFLAKWTAEIPSTPVGKIEKQEVRGGQFYVFDFRASMLPDEVFDEIRREWSRARIPRATQEELVAWLKSQRVVAAAGVLDGYLMLSLGSDLSMLEKWGSGTSLAESATFEPVRKHYRDGLASVSYCSEPLLSTFAWTKDDLRALLTGATGIIGDSGAPAGLADRLEKDGTRLIEEVTLPVMKAYLSTSFDNQGVETLTFGGLPAVHDFSEPLSILAHRGKDPILCGASHAVESPGVYEDAVKWLKVAFGYFEDFVVPSMEPGDREGYEKCMKFVLPFLKSIDATTRECLIPAIDGTQSLFVLDGGGTLARVPANPPFPRPIPIPRIAVAGLLNDPAKFKEGMQRYADAIRKLIDDARETFPKSIPPQIQLPPPMTEAVAGGTLYYYRVPGGMGRDVFPCALLKGSLLVVSSSATLVEEMAEEREMPSCPMMELGEAAGAIAIVDATKGWLYLERLTDAVFPLLNQGRRVGRDARTQMMMVKMHIDTLFQSLRAIRYHASMTTKDDDEIMRHSWLHVEDIGK